MKILVAAIVVAVVAIGAYFLFTQKAAAPDEADVVTPGTQESDRPLVNDVAVITYSENGFSPESVQVSVGDTVTFKNESSVGMWVGSNEHPTHTEYDGTSTREHCVDGVATHDTFDMCHAGLQGESWSYTFTKEGTWDFHNHARANHTGRVIVTQ